MHVNRIIHDGDNFIVWVDNLHPDTPESHPHTFSVVAVADRKVVYGLDTDEEAIDALLKEIDQLLNGTQRKPLWHPKAAEWRERHLEPHREIIAEHYERFTTEVGENNVS